MRKHLPRRKKKNSCSITYIPSLNTKWNYISDLELKTSYASGHRIRPRDASWAVGAWHDWRPTCRFLQIQKLEPNADPQPQKVLRKAACQTRLGRQRTMGGEMEPTSSWRHRRRTPTLSCSPANQNETRGTHCTDHVVGCGSSWCRYRMWFVLKELGVFGDWIMEYLTHFGNEGGLSMWPSINWFLFNAPDDLSIE